jgi:hypothetical protein
LLQDTLYYHMKVLLHNKSPDLLQLAMNCSSGTAATAAARSLLETPGDFEPQVTRRLLITATKRQHMSAVNSMLTAAPVQQHMDTHTHLRYCCSP